jgi:predicted metal-dependent hydrolase
MNPNPRVDAEDDPITVEVIRDRRLRTRIHWEWDGDHVRIRVPHHIPKDQLDCHVSEILDEVRQRRCAVHARADADLEAMARQLNARYFDNAITWHSIRWVSNMRRRLGSCTVGGPTDGDIRISDRVKGWPQWVIEYIIAHELSHRKYPNHSSEFWKYLSSYPLAERARGFILGLAFQLDEDAESWL